MLGPSSESICKRAPFDTDRPATPLFWEVTNPSTKQVAPYEQRRPFSPLCSASRPLAPAALPVKVPTEFSTTLTPFAPLKLILLSSNRTVEPPLTTTPLPPLF